METELMLSAEREAALAKELGRCKAECCELQTKLANASDSASKAKRAAREALIDMAEQNAKLVAAYVEKKREVKQLQAAAKEDRRLWQQRLQRMEQELQANKRHITALMQQLHAVAAKQVNEQGTPSCSHQPTLTRGQSSSAGCSPINNSFPSSFESASRGQADTCLSNGDSSPAEVTSRTPLSTAAGFNPLADRTNTFNSRPSNAAKPTTQTSNCQTPNRAYGLGIPFEYYHKSHHDSAAPATAAKAYYCQQQQQDQALMRDQGIEQPAGHSQQPGQQHDSSLKDVDLHSRLLQRLAECTSTVQQAANSLGQQQLPDTVVANTQPQPQQQDPKQQHAARQQHPQPQLQEQQRLLTEQLQREQLEKQQQLADLQQRLQHELHKLQQRAQQLEIENAALRDAQAQADVLRSKVERMHQAEQLKQCGNRHYQCQQYKQAHATYSEALALSVEDPTFNAVLLCNRAAAQHSLGQYLEAIADCCVAAQLDDKYARVLQRRAEAYMAIDDYSSAVADLQRLVELNSNSREAAQKLKDAQHKQRMHGTAGPNYYLVLGLQSGCSTSEVKAAYKKLALRYHPDKASGGPHAKASSEAVFVLITAAHSVLADSAKRAAYDASQHAARIKRSMSSSSSGLSRRDSSSSSGGIYNWHYQQANGFAGSYAGAAKAAATAAAAAEQARWRSQGRNASHNYGGTYGRDNGGSSSSASSGATYHK